MDKFLEIYNLPTKSGRKYRLINSNKIESVVKIQDQLAS